MKHNSVKDPLLVIIEKHVFKNSDETSSASNTFIESIIEDYLKYLNSQGVHIPAPVKKLFLEDIREEVRELLVKNTFGISSKASSQQIPSDAAQIVNKTLSKLSRRLT